MPEFDLAEGYSATYTRYRADYGFVAKGVVRYQGKPVQIFEAYGPALHQMRTAARNGAEQVYRAIRAREAKKQQPR